LFSVIPAGKERFVVKGTSYVTEDMVLYDIMPHMHMVGKAIKVTMTPPEGQPTLLFNIKDWDYNWQETYYFKEPLRLKPGTRLDLEAIYDNSVNNPNNPFNPPRAVTLGEQTFNEMCFVFLGGTSERKGNGLPLARSPAKKAVLKDIDAGKTYAVPFHLTDSGHILVRAKINGKGPFNFILDTGAPLLYIAVPVAKQIGIKRPLSPPASPGRQSGGQGVNGGETDKPAAMTTLETFQVEGGPVHAPFQCIVETPFQLEGMNAMGIPGVELHGVIGYTLLAHYKMEIDPTRDRMMWTKLDFTPPAPQASGPKGSAPAGLDNLGKFMKAFAVLMGIKGAPEPSLRGFLGVQLAEVGKDKGLMVEGVLANSPAATAGVVAGDRIVAVQGKEVATPAEAMAILAKVAAGQQVSFIVQRAEGQKEITITAGEGL